MSAAHPVPVDASERWLRLLLRLYPADFRDEMGEALVETYRDRCRAAARDGGASDARRSRRSGRPDARCRSRPDDA